MTSRSKKYNYNINASGDFATNNLNLGVANMFSGSFSASNSVVTPTDVTGLSFNSVAVRSFQCQMTVTIDRTIGGSLYETFTIEGHQTASGWGLYITSLGDITGVVFTITSVGQVRYTSTTVANFVSSMFRFTVTQIANSGTYASLNSSTGGTYLLNSVQITNTVASVLGTDPGALYVLGGSTFEKAITIKTTDNAIGLGTGGGLSIFGGAAVSKDLLVGGNLGIGTASPSTTLDITGTARVSGVISAGTSVVTTRTGGTLALSGSITVANIVTPGTVSAGTSVVTTRTGGSMSLSGALAAASGTIGTFVATTVSAGTMVATVFTGGSLSLSGDVNIAGTLTTVNITTTNLVDTNISAGTLVATTLSAGTAVATTFTGGSLDVSGTVRAGNIVTPGTVSAGTVNVSQLRLGNILMISQYNIMNVNHMTTNNLLVPLQISAGTIRAVTYTGGSMSLSGALATTTGTIGTFVSTTSSAGTSVVTIRTGGSMALSGSITAANIVIPSTLRATGTSNTIANIFTTGGNVGIGLTTPTQQFQVSGNIGVENGYFEGLNESNNITGNTEWTLIRARNGAGIWGYKGASNHQGSLIFKTHSLFNTPVERLRITESGGVGIGTASPSSRLSVNGNINFSSYGQRVGFDVESDWWNYNGNVVGHYSLGWYGGIFGSPATAVLSGYQGVVLASEGIPRFTVRRDGTIGIATTAPVTTLHANGTTLISNGILHARDYGDDGRHCIMFGSGEWGKNFGITSAFSIRYYSNGGEGTHAYTTIATYRASTYGGGVGTDTRISTTGTFTNFLFLSGEHRIGINTIPSYELHLNSDSAAKPNGGTWTTASDRRLKTGITMANLSICYDNIKAIPLKRYTWRDDVYTHEQVADRTKLGWIAQDVETVIPKAVDQKTMYGIEDCRSLNSDQIIATLYGCVQKLIEKVEDLETKQTETDTVIQKLRAKFPGEF